MIFILTPDITEEDKAHLQRELKREGCSFKEVRVGDRQLLEVKDSPSQDLELLGAMLGVEEIVSSAAPWKLASRDNHPADTVVPVGEVALGGDRLVVIAGPCAVESREQALTIAEAVKRRGAVLFRGGAFKPRSSPYSFQGLGEEGLKILAEVRETTGLRVVTEMLSPNHADLMMKYVDVLQVGARNMQNFELLKCVGRLNKPVVLKRGLSATIEEWLMSAEYILAEGNPNVILCERGIRTFEPYTRNTLDLSAIPVMKRLTHLPIIIDPSHATGIRSKVSPMARAAVAAGADGLTIEVHHEPDKALSDGPQSLFPDQFGQLMRDVHVIAPVVGKQLDFDYLEKAKTIARATPASGESELAVAALGEEGAFSHRAAVQYFGSEPTLVSARSYKGVFEAIAGGHARYGVVPLENSLTGSVHENYDLLLEFGFSLVGEILLRIEYSLVAPAGVKLCDVQRVLASPDALRQCHEFLAAQGCQQLVTRDEIAAVRAVAEKAAPTEAAIATRESGQAHGLEVLQEGIESNPRNYTRFGIVGAEPLTTGPRRKSSLIFQTPNRPGALREVLSLFADHGINLVKLESRPVHGKPWEYLFYVDLEADAKSEGFQPIIQTLAEKTEFLAVLGSY